MNPETESAHAVQLDWSDDDGLVTVTPRNQDRFNLKVRRAIEACKAAVQEDEFRDQFNLLLSQLAQWLAGRRDIDSAHLTTRDGAMLFLVVRSASKYDREFEDALSELDLQIASDVDLGLIRLDTLALPLVSREALRSFLDPGFTLTYAYGDRNRPHRARKSKS